VDDEGLHARSLCGERKERGMAERRVGRRRVLQVRAGATRSALDDLAGEEPLEIRVDGQPVAVTMRTPGDDFDLALGFCLTEGILDSADEVGSLRYCTPPDQQQYNVIDVARRVPGTVDDRLRRNVYTTSSCGVCGTASIEAVRRQAPELVDTGMQIDVTVAAALPDRLRKAQRVFERTGGIHAAGIFTADGSLLCAREDVGRHNAVDKVIGWAAREGRLPMSACVLCVSGRVAFEIVQKALAAGMPAVVAVSAPTSLAVTLAAEAGMTLAGFVRDGDMNVYAGADRISGVG
jgi:FdhD protein